MFVCVKAPGSCGELVQGTIAGQSFLLTCPINLYSTATLISQPSVLIEAGPKVKEAIKKTLTYLTIANAGFHISIHSELPQGKGMASSSADISAACQAIALHAGNFLSPAEIAAIAISIEPTDAIFYPGVVMFDHITGMNSRHLGKPPPVTIAVFDAGGEIDTLFFNQRTDLTRLNAAKEEQVRQALELVIKGLRTGAAELVGRGATLSAIANQRILYKPCLETVIGLAEKYGAVGVNAAHSGTVLGIMFKPDRLDRYDHCIAAVQQACPEMRFIKTVQLIPGGLQIAGDHNE